MERGAIRKPKPKRLGSKIQPGAQGGVAHRPLTGGRDVGRRGQPSGCPMAVHRENDSTDSAREVHHYEAALRDRQWTGDVSDRETHEARKENEVSRTSPSRREVTGVLTEGDEAVRTDRMDRLAEAASAVEQDSDDEQTPSGAPNRKITRRCAGCIPFRTASIRFPGS